MKIKKWQFIAFWGFVYTAVSFTIGYVFMLSLLLLSPLFYWVCGADLSFLELVARSWEYNPVLEKIYVASYMGFTLSIVMLPLGVRQGIKIYKDHESELDG